jgi:transposase
MMSESKPVSRRVVGKIDLEFRKNAVRLVTEEGYTFVAAAKAVGVSSRSLRTWHNQLAPSPKPCGSDASLDELRAENQRLRQQLRRTEMEREILKKATAYFAKESL